MTQQSNGSSKRAGGEDRMDLLVCIPCRDAGSTKPTPVAINVVLPLFWDSAHSVAMIKHSITTAKAVIKHLNPGQVPVLDAGQPLFALARKFNGFGQVH